MHVQHDKAAAEIQKGQIKYGVYIITVLFSLLYSFRYGKNGVIQSILVTVLLLGIGGYYIIKKNKDSTFYAAKELFAVLWTALYLILPIRGLPVPDHIEFYLKRILDVFRSSERTLIIFSVAFLLILNIFGEKFKDSFVYLAGIYISIYLIVSEVFRISFTIDTYFIFLITVFVFLSDLARKIVYRQKSEFMKLVLLYLILYILLILYPDEGIVTRIQNLLYLEEVWTRVSAILVISGGICLFENYKSLQDLSSGEMTGEFAEGCALAALAVYIFVGKCWPQYFHLIIVYTAFPLIILLKEYIANQINDGRAVLLYWVCVLLCLPALGRTLNENSRYCMIILALFLIRHVLMRMSWKVEKEVILQDFRGIAATILLFAARYNVYDMNMIRKLIDPFLVLIGSCVLWVMLTHQTYTFNRQLIKGKYPKNDYGTTLIIQKIALTLVLGILLFRLLT